MRIGIGEPQPRSGARRAQQGHIVRVDHRCVCGVAMGPPSRPAVERAERFGSSRHVPKAPEPDETARVAQVAKRTEHVTANRRLGLDELTLEQLDQRLVHVAMQRVLAQPHHLKVENAHEAPLYRISHLGARTTAARSGACGVRRSCAADSLSTRRRCPVAYAGAARPRYAPIASRTSSRHRCSLTRAFPMGRSIWAHVGGKRRDGSRRALMRSAPGCACLRADGSRWNCSELTSQRLRREPPADPTGGGRYPALGPSSPRSSASGGQCAPARTCGCWGHRRCGPHAAHACANGCAPCRSRLNARGLARPASWTAMRRMRLSPNLPAGWCRSAQGAESPWACGPPGWRSFRRAMAELAGLAALAPLPAAYRALSSECRSGPATRTVRVCRNGAIAAGQPHMRGGSTRRGFRRRIERGLFGAGEPAEAGPPPLSRGASGTGTQRSLPRDKMDVYSVSRDCAQFARCQPWTPDSSWFCFHLPPALHSVWASLR